MTNKQRQIMHRYKGYSSDEILETILNNVKIREEILLKSSLLELCEYLNKIEEIKGDVKWIRKRL